MSWTIESTAVAKSIQKMLPLNDISFNAQLANFSVKRFLLSSLELCGALQKFFHKPLG